MRIGIDAKFLTHPQRGGFKTYSEHLVQALALIDKENEYILYVDRPPLDTDLIPSQNNFSTKIVSASKQFYSMPWREQYSLVHQVNKDKIDIFHAPCLSGPIALDVPNIVTIHDMIWYYPTRYTPNTGKAYISKRTLMQWYFRILPYIVAKKANAVIAVSNASKQRIVEHLNLPSEKIFVIYLAAKTIYRLLAATEAEKKVVQGFGLKTNYILGLGSADPRKNIKSLIQAYACLPAHLMKSYHLAIVWNHQNLASEAFLEAQKLNISEHVRFLYSVSDEDLVSLYNRASLFVFPSLEEGFGLPPLEAMACGTPVIAANNSSIPEIVGEAALQFSAENVKELTGLITRVLSDMNLQKKMRMSGIERATEFSWEKCAVQTLNAYKQAIIS